MGAVKGKNRLFPGILNYTLSRVYRPARVTKYHESGIDSTSPKWGHLERKACIMKRHVFPVIFVVTLIVIILQIIL